MSTGFLSKVRSNVADKLRTRFSSSEYVIRYNQYVTDDNWGPSAPDMDEIAKMYPEGYYDLLPEMQLRLDNRDANWRRCYKTLLVIDHLARVLSHNYLEDLRAFVPTLREINANYKYTDSAGTDRGVSVRERAKKVADLLNDDVLLMEEREKTEKTRRAMRGVGCVDGVTNAGVHSGGDSSKYSGFGAGSGATAAPASDLSAPSSDTSANDRRAQQEAADRRIAQALQDEEDARARVEARRRARGEGSPTTAAPPAAAVAADHDDGFGELQAVETSAAAAHSKPATAEDDFGAFVDSRPSQSGGGAGTTDLDAMFAAPAPASQPKPAAAQPASIDDIFGAPAPAPTSAPAAAQPPRGTELDIFAGPSHSGTTTLNQQGSAAPPRQPVW